LEQGGWEILESKVTVMPLELVLGLSPTNPLMRALTGMLAAVTAIFPGLLGYQLMYVVKPRT
jgi:hypothetical protein